MKPILDKILIEKLPEEKKTTSGIFLPTGNIDTNPTATVLAVGHGTKKEKIKVKEGDKIMFQRDTDIAFEIDGKQYTLIHHQSIIAIL